MLIGIKRGLAVLGASAAIVASVAATSASAAAPSLSTKYAPGLGTVLTDGAGRTLYTFAKDQSGVSNCYDTCASFWPPLASDTPPDGQPGFDAKFGSITRTDGSHQVTYKGMPLYYFIADKQPGDVHGYAKNGVWFTVESTVAPTVQIRRDASLGPLLADAQGKTLYMYTNDTPGASNCSGDCASFWPPLVVDASTLPTGPDTIAAGLGTTTRDDGTQQVTYNGIPLYYWAKDMKPCASKRAAQGACLKLRGHYGYYGITGNSQMLNRFLQAVQRRWHYWLNRRSQQRKWTWARVCAVSAGAPAAASHPRPLRLASRSESVI